jgi:phage terminase large subunit-like protein
MTEWSTACLDWEKRIVERRSLIAAPLLFPDQAEAAWDICSRLKIADIGGLTVGESSLPWLKDFIMTVFGSYDEVEGRRHINELFLMVSKKNAKSTIAAAIMLTALIMNWRTSAELIIVSPRKEVADNSYKPIEDMIKADDELSALLHVQSYFRLITHRGTGATLKVLAADSDTVSGKKASFVFIDELHEFGKQAKASNVLLEATGGLTSRPEGFVIYATTQSADPPAGVFKEKLQYARKVRDGIIKDRKFLPVIYEFPDHMLQAGAHRNLENAYVTNPNWGASVDVERIEQIYRQSQEGGEESFREFMAKHLNVEIGLALRSDRWAGADHWESRSQKGLTLESLLERCEVIEVGIDGGGLDDLLGLSVAGRCKKTREWLVWCRAWAHPSVLERRKDIVSRLNDFARDGDLVLVNRVGDDVEEVADIVHRIHEAKLLDKVGVDPSGLGGVLDALAQVGIPEDRIVGISQGWRMTGSIKTAERKLAEGVITHGGQAMMAWCVGNAKVEPRGNAIIITKQASGSAKIDPLLAMFNAISLLALNPPAMKKKYKMVVLG